MTTVRKATQRTLHMTGRSHGSGNSRTLGLSTRVAIVQTTAEKAAEAKKAAQVAALEEKKDTERTFLRSIRTDSGSNVAWSTLIEAIVTPGPTMGHSEIIDSGQIKDWGGAYNPDLRRWGAPSAQILITLVTETRWRPGLDKSSHEDYAPISSKDLIKTVRAFQAFRLTSLRAAADTRAVADQATKGQKRKNVYPESTQGDLKRLQVEYGLSADDVASLDEQDLGPHDGISPAAYVLRGITSGEVDQVRRHGREPRLVRLERGGL